MQMMFDVESLINMVYANRILYDVTHEEFKNNKKKEAVWNEIGAEMGKSGEDTKKKWRNLRDTYSKYLKVAATRKYHSENKKQWIWAEHMSVFQPYHGFAPRISRYDPLELEIVPMAELNEEPTVEYEDVENACPTTTVLPAENEETYINDVKPAENEETYINDVKPAENEETYINDVKPAIKAPESDDDCIAIETNTNSHRKRNRSFKQVVNRVENKKKRKNEHDAIDCLFLAHAKTLKTFSKKGQIVTKMKIAQIMMEQELLEQDNLNFINTSPTNEVVRYNTNTLNHSQSSSSIEYIY